MRGTLILIVSAQLLIPALAQADVITPEFAACMNKQEGDACLVTESTTPLDGTCQIEEQCLLDYSNLCDSGAPCGTICADALKCKVANKDAGPVDVNTTVKDANTLNKDATTVIADKDAGTADKDTSDSGSCAVSSRSLPPSSGIFFLVGLLLIWRLRRS